MIELIDIQNMFYSVYIKTIPIDIFEIWLYENDRIENILGNELYFNLLNINYRDKYANLEVEKLIIPHIDFGRCETLRITGLLKNIVDEKGDFYAIMSQLYDDYCKGYLFLRFLGLSYIVNEDENDMSKGLKNLLKDKNEYKKEAVRLLGFFEKDELIITGEFYYGDYRKEQDGIELNQIEKMSKGRD